MKQKIFVEKETLAIFNAKLKNYDLVWDKQDRLLHLFEEVGEFSEVILQYHRRKEPKKTEKDIENGIADILEDLFSLCILYEIDINKVINKVIYEE